MKRKELQKSKGITLLALVITIIVLIILAGVTISMVVGDNGVINKAKDAKQNMTNAAEEENQGLKDVEEEMNLLLQGQVITTDPEEPEQPDTEGPTVEMEVVENGGTYVKVTVTASDPSGIKEYQYLLNGTPIDTTNSGDYKFENLTEETDYTLKVIVVDNKGNTSEFEMPVKTIEILPTSIQELTEGTYVSYKDGSGAVKKAIILYGAENSNYSTYGIQIITADNVKELNYGNHKEEVLADDREAFNQAQSDYNNLVTNLNNEAEQYRVAQNNTMLKSARSVGSVPNNPSYESGMLPDTYGYLSAFGQFRDTDTNYTSDYNQLEKLVSDGKIANVGDDYWLASRYAIPRDGNTVVRGRCVDSGHDNDYNFCMVGNSGGITSYNITFGLRVVFTLDESLNIKITGGEGTETEPYMLEI